MKLSEGKVELVRRQNKVVYQDGNRVLKVFNDQKPASDVFNEALNTARIMDTDIKVSEVLEVSRVEGGEWDGSWAIANHFIPGTNLHAILDADENHADEVLQRLVDLQITVHQTAAPLLNRQKDKLARMVHSVKAIDPTTRYDLEMRIDGLHNIGKVCHGDFVPSNVIVADDGDLYLCDWAHVTSGDPVVDAAQTYLLLQLRHPRFASSYLDLYSKTADVAKQRIFYWVPVVAAAELSRGRKRDEEFLMKQITVGDFE
jgi:thiamine kinase-like enzyme